MKRYALLCISILILGNIALGQTAEKNKNGNLTVNVVKHLEFSVDEANLKFTYNEFKPSGPPKTDEENSSLITIKTNVDWKFSVCTDAGVVNLVNESKPSATIPANRFSFYTLTTPSEITSNSDKRQLGPECLNPILGKKSKDLSFWLYWEVQPTFTENLYAGNYKANIVYCLSEQ